MESYRYQLTTRADFEVFIGFLIDNKINFTTNHNYVPSAGDHVYHVTVTSEDKEAEEIFKCVGSFLDNATDLRKAENVTSLYNDASEAYNDPYCDPITLRTMLGDSINLIKKLNNGSNSIIEDLKKQLEDAKSDAKYYKNAYNLNVKFNLRIKKQILAVTGILETIYIDD